MQVRSVLLWGLVTFAIPFATTAQPLLEKQVEQCVCEGMQTQVRTPAGTIIDCVSETHAIEIDPTTNWAAAIGQSLHYASQTGLKPKVILFCRADRGLNCLQDQLRFESTVAAYDLPIEAEFYGWADLREICR